MRRKAMRVPVSYRRTESVSIGGKVLVQDRYASGYLDAPINRIPPHILLHVQAFGSFGGPGRQPGKPHRKAYDN